MHNSLGHATEASSTVECILKRNLPSVAAAALRQTLQDAALAAPLPDTQSANHQRQANLWTEASSQIQLLAALKSVIAVTATLRWCIRAAEAVLVDQAQPAHTHKQGVTLLTQLCGVRIWQAVSDACSRLLMRTLLPTGSSALVPPLGAEGAGRWAELLRLAVGPSPGPSASGHKFVYHRPPLIVLPEMVSKALEGLYEATAEVLADSCRAIELLAVAVNNACLDTPQHESALLGCFFDSLYRSSVLDVLCSALLRLDPAHPPTGMHGVAFVSFAMNALSFMLGAAGTLAGCATIHGVCTCCGKPRGDCSQGGNCREDHATWLDRSQRCLQAVSAPNVLQLVHAAAECFLQELPPPPLAVAFAPSLAGLPQAQAVTAAPDVAAFLPSSSPADELSNKMLQCTWRLLAVCPFAKHLPVNLKGEAGTLERAARFLSALLPLWALPFKEPGCHPAIKAVLPGLSGFCRVAARASRWAAYSLAVAEGQPAVWHGAAGQQVQRAAFRAFSLPDHVSSWEKVRRGHSSCLGVLRAAVGDGPSRCLDTFVQRAAPGALGWGQHGGGWLARCWGLTWGAAYPIIAIPHQLTGHGWQRAACLLQSTK